MDGGPYTLYQVIFEARVKNPSREQIYRFYKWAYWWIYCENCEWFSLEARQYEYPCNGFQQWIAYSLQIFG